MSGASSMRLARYSAFPRADKDHGVQTGFTRACGDDSLCLVTAAPEPVGSLLRLETFELRASETPERLARVVECTEAASGRFELTLEALGRPRVRPARRGGRKGADLRERSA